MADISVAILGLGQLGTSLGLALKRYNADDDATNHFSITAHEPLSSLERAARELGAFDNSANNLSAAVRDKDIVIVATPYAETQTLFRQIGDMMREGTVVIDTSPLKHPSIHWAGDFFPEGVHLIGVTPVLNPDYLFDGVRDTQHARADLFDGGSLIISIAASANRDALNLVTNMASLLGLDVHFMDPAEHDGLVALTEGLPAVLAAAAFRTAAASQGWQEAQRVTNPAFGKLTHHLMDTHPDDLRDILLNNREHVARYLDAMIQTLSQYRDLLAEDDTESLEAALTDAEAKYQGWLRRRSGGRWEERLSQADSSMRGNLLSGMVGGFLANRLRGKDNDR